MPPRPEISGERLRRATLEAVVLSAHGVERAHDPNSITKERKR